MAGLRASLHSKIAVTKDLSRLAAKLNDSVHKGSDSHTFISFFFGLLDRGRGEFEYVNAGHNPPLLVDAAGSLRSPRQHRLLPGDVPLGELRDADRPLRSPGDILCLFTDGIVESRNAGKEEFGDDRLARRLRESAGFPAREIMDRIYEDAFAFSSCAEPGDDMTIVVVKRRS